MALAQVAVATCFALPVLFFLGLAVHSIYTAIRGEMERDADEASTRNVVKVFVGLAALIVSGALIAGGSALVRWLA